jgi:two-component system, OmpR family, response regulator
MTRGRVRRWSTRTAGHIQAIPRILVVDDERNAADALSAFLAFLGYDVRAAYSTWGAFAQMDDWTPEIVVLDISMPEYDGFVAVGALRRSERTANAFIFAYTALTEEHVKERDHQQYFDAYCQKGALDELVWLLKDVAARAR